MPFDNTLGVLNTGNNAGGIVTPHPMDEQELKTIISNEITLALGMDGGKLSHERRRLLERYLGERMGNEIEGRSQVQARSVLETVEWATPALLRLFVASDKVVEFHPYRPDEELMAQQATDYCNYIITQDNNFFTVLADWIRTALIQKMGYVKVYWANEKTHSTSTFTALNDMEYHQIVSATDVEIISENAYPNPDPNMLWFAGDSPNPTISGGTPMLHDIKIRITQIEGRVKIENVLPEEILVSRRAPNVVLDGKHFVCQRSLKRVSDLREVGYPEDLIEQAMGFNEQEFNSERIARYMKDDDWPMGSDADNVDPSMREVWLEETYIAVDYNGDGIAELRRIISAGSGQVIFENEEADQVPFISICPIPLPGKHIGLSLADLVNDIQEIKTVLLRQSLDNLYLTNSPRVIVDENAMSDNSYDDLLSVRPGGIVRVSNIQGIEPLTVPFVASNTLQMMEYLDQAQEIRTGISRQNQGISPDDLNQTATGISLVQQAAAQRLELIARTFAEQGMKQLGRMVLGLVIRHQQDGRIIRLTGKWVQMDPRDWRENMQCSISVGLGTGNRDNILTHLNQILQIQNQVVMLQKGISGPLVNGQNIYAVLKRLCENAGFKDEFFMDPSQQPPGPPQPPPPNPEMEKAQGEIAANQARTQADIANDQAKAKSEMDVNTQKAQQEMAILAMKQQHQTEMERIREQSKAEISLLQQQQKMNETPPPPIAFHTPSIPGIPGSRQAPDGNHYVPDIRRPGKFLQII